ncbi:hypothetical protein GCM10012287_46720 [Streptomyces daqingensis]|uniref:Uncharacterized protein n=1 Tax=Streptomyces daqingensis TaxID=1472640 RepID=A0ABQ2MP67_9ACTN|nr:hypothetical protein [Streptomyces daqingensis]GGO55441.1 hypothetical protein GCM10012287_46720 [Streptomyces daqingensis]
MDYAGQKSLRPVFDVMAKGAAAMRVHEALGWQRIGVGKHIYGDAQQRTPREPGGGPPRRVRQLIAERLLLYAQAYGAHVGASWTAEKQRAQTSTRQ